MCGFKLKIQENKKITDFKLNSQQVPSIRTCAIHNSQVGNAIFLILNNLILKLAILYPFFNFKIKKSQFFNFADLLNVSK